MDPYLTAMKPEIRICKSVVGLFLQLVNDPIRIRFIIIAQVFIIELTNKVTRLI
jgi:hypothetical protein